MEIRNRDVVHSENFTDGSLKRFPRRDLLRVAVGGGSGLALGGLVDLSARTVKLFKPSENS